MKSLRILIIISILAWGAVSCKDVYQDDYMAISTEHCTFPAEGGTQLIEVVSSGDFTISQADADWCTVAVEHGDISVTVGPNVSESERITAFSITPDYTEDVYTVTVMQAPAGETVLVLSDTSSVHVFDATGGAYRFSVRSNVSWQAVIDSDYYTVKTDESSMEITVEAPVNETGDNHEATLTVTAGSGGNSASVQIAISQLTKAQSPYYQFIGNWDMYCSEWVYGDTRISDGGTYTSCNIVENVPGESYEIQGLFYTTDDGVTFTRLPAFFNPDDNTMEIEVGEQCGLYIYGMYPVYFMMCNMSDNSLQYDKLLTCTIADDGNRINVEGFDPGYGWGIFPYMGGSYSRMADLYYAASDDSYFIRGGE